MLVARRDILFALGIAAIYPFGLYVTNISYVLCFASPVLLLLLLMRGFSLGITNRSDGYVLVTTWFLGFLVALAFGSWRRGDDLGTTRLFDMATLSGPFLAISVQLALRQKILKVDSIEWGAFGCALLFPILVLIRTSFSDWALIPQYRFGSTADVNPNHVADIYDVLVPIVAFLALSSRPASLKRTAIFLVLTSLFLVHILTGTRGSLPSIFVIFVYVITSNNLSRQSRAFLLSGVILGVIALSDSLLSRLTMRTIGDVLSSITRVWLIEAALNMLRENHYFFGFGVDRFASMKLEFGFPRWVDPKGLMSSHNIHLDIYLGFGLIGLLGWLVFNVKIAFRLLKPHKYVSRSLPGLIGLFGFLIHSLVDCLLVLNSFITLIWIFYGYWMHVGDLKMNDACGGSAGLVEDEADSGRSPQSQLS